MKVRDLINDLKYYNPEMEVVIGVPLNKEMTYIPIRQSGVIKTTSLGNYTLDMYPNDVQDIHEELSDKEDN